MTYSAQYLGVHLPNILPQYATRRAARWDMYMQQQRPLGKICRRITAGRPKEEVFVGFGHWSGGRMPIKGLRQRLQSVATVFVVDESYTSKTCSACMTRECLLRPFVPRDSRSGWALKVVSTKTGFGTAMSTGPTTSWSFSRPCSAVKGVPITYASLALWTRAVVHVLVF